MLQRKRYVAAAIVRLRRYDAVRQSCVYLEKKKKTRGIHMINSHRGRDGARGKK